MPADIPCVPNAKLLWQRDPLPPAAEQVTVFILLLCKLLSIRMYFIFSDYFSAI